MWHVNMMEIGELFWGKKQSTLFLFSVSVFHKFDFSLMWINTKLEKQGACEFQWEKQYDYNQLIIMFQKTNIH